MGFGAKVRNAWLQRLQPRVNDRWRSAAAVACPSGAHGAASRGLGFKSVQFVQYMGIFVKCVVKPNVGCQRYRRY